MAELGREFEIPGDIAHVEDRFEFLNKLFKYCLDGRVLHSEQLTKLMTQFGQLLEPIPSAYEIENRGDLTIVGDLHGSLPDFKILFTKKIHISKFLSNDD